MARRNLSPANQREYLSSSSYDTRNLSNPFQDNYTATASTPAPTAADTIPSSSSSSSTSFAPSATHKATAPPIHTPSAEMHLRQLEQQVETDRSESKSITTYCRNSSYQDHPTNSTRDSSLEQENPLVYLTPNQRQAAVENLEIEALDRIQKLRASIGVLTNSLKFRSEAEINRLPAAIRAMTVEEFWFTYNGSAKEYLERQQKDKTVANTTFLHAFGMTERKRLKR
ncbi:hypothetical protein BGX28_004016 [Mortierella sp. GBA30]|nr:hypothetical protein BGX28_004016 [Mortierella sp. GBA30]